MSPEKTTLEIIAPTIEEAIETGLGQLGIPRDAVDVEVLDAGSKGLFGLGSRQSRVRLTIKSPDDEMGKPAAAKPAVKRAPKPASKPADEPEAASLPSARVSAPASNKTEGISSDDEFELEVATDVVRQLLEKMKVHATVSAQFIQPQDEHDDRMVMVEVQGNDLSILIGRRSETLNALQYISSLIICKEVGHWVPLLIDVQGYRVRRERQLRQLAHRMAEQAINTGKRQVLEPMPANERRIIHLELRDHETVTTESTGEEPNRKVTVVLKNNP